MTIFVIGRLLAGPALYETERTEMIDLAPAASVAVAAITTGAR